MIVGGTVTARLSKKARKTYLRMVQNVQLTGSIPKIEWRENPIIGFSEEDVRHLHHPHDDALVVSIRVEDYNMHRVLVDNGSLADILYHPAFQQMGIDREMIDPEEHSSRRFWRYKGAPLRHSHIIRSGR